AGTFSPVATIINGGSNAVNYAASATELSNGAVITLTLTSDDGDGAGPCPIETDVTTITINTIPQQPVATSPPDYCVNQAVLPLIATGSNLKWYDNPVIIPANQKGVGASFPSGVIADVAKEVDFFVTQTSQQGCESPSTHVTITVNPLPTPDFNAANYCLGDAMAFTDLSTISVGSIIEWSWRFDDGDELPINAGSIPAGTHNDRTAGTFNQPSHTYGAIGNYNIRLLVRSSEGCENSIVKPFSVGPIPTADFTFRNLCEDQVTNFTYGISPGIITLREWNFGDTNSGLYNLFTDNTVSPPGNAQAVNHGFSAVGSYPVSLKLTTNLGCEDEVIKTVSILPYIDDEYTQSFESPDHGWASEGLNTNGFNSWSISVPFAEEVTSAVDGNQFWITRDSNLSPPSYALNERSALYTPCFNISSIERPVISFYYWNDTDLRADGAYLESSVDGGLTWQRLGNLVDGQNWYNTAGISGLASQNGVGQSIEQMGWSEKTEGWVNARLGLNTFAANNRVRFRFVFGSNADVNLTETNNGFALDAFSISTRNRILLAENFTNMANPASANVNNTSFRNFNSGLNTS
ncbi:MAG: PKD domain-containing protein, partial [Cyclobacteriaceae bacterium]|nr:PKD domain-containing protein [Cyclobacteriaceae bacterium]